MAGKARAATGDALQRPRLAFSLDVDADDRAVRGPVLGSNRGEVSLNAFPGSMLIHIGVGVVRHAGGFHAIVALRVLVGGAHQRHRPMDRDEFVAGVPVNDNFGIEQRLR